MTQRRLRAIWAAGQHTNVSREFQLLEESDEVPGTFEPVDLSDADTVTVTLVHDSWGHTAVDELEGEVTDADEGKVEFTFTAEHLAAYGDHRIQFEVDYGDEEQLVPPNTGDWIIAVGRRSAGADLPLDISELTAADAVIGSLDVDEIDGGIVTNGPLNGSLHGPGLTIDNGDLAVTLDIDEIEGLSNPLNEHIDANNYDITSIREVDAQSASVSSEPENPSDAARLSEINDVSNEIEDTRTQLESDIDSIEEQTSGLSSDGSDATFDSFKTREASIGQDTTTEDSLTLEHPETGAQFEFGPDGTFSIDQLYTSGGDSDLHYDRVYRDIWEDETIDANISVNADRDQIIKIDSFRADTSSSLYLRFDGKDSENYSYTAEDAGTGDGVHGSEDTEIPIINNVDDSFPAGGFAGRYEIVNPRSSRPGIIGDGVTRNLEAGEEILKRGTFDNSTYPSEINIYTNNTVEECEIEVLEPVPDASRPTDQWG